LHRFCASQARPHPLILKRTTSTAGLWIVPRTGHAVNLEEPDAFNRNVQEFFGIVERGKWTPRDPRTLAGGGELIGSRTRS
jgi:hypothetical protein